MLHNLSAEMARKNIDNKAIAEVLGCNEKTIKRKRNGLGDFSVSEWKNCRADACYVGMGGSRARKLLAHIQQHVRQCGARKKAI